MSDLTIQDLCRLSHLPDSDNPAEQIAGQKYYDVEFTGGSITGITPSGLPTPLAIADGGTGQITATAALNALLPTQVGQSGKTLNTNGTNVSWQAAGASGITQLTGDVTAGPGSGSVAATLATVNSNVGTFGSATAASQVTVNAKGLVTAASSITVTPAVTSLTGSAALTKTDDTNVTLTLGGTPATSLIRATSITVGWTGILAAARGGTANAFTAFSGPATSTKTFTLPNANSSILTDNAAVTVAQGGTGLTTLTTGNVILGAGTSSPTFVAPGTSGNVLTSNGSTWASTALTAFTNVVIQTFTSSGTYTPTSGMKFCIAEAVGGGGGGGPTASAGTAGGGGGAGGYSRRRLTAAQISGSQVVTIGAAGAAGGTGGNTSLGTLVVANGGSGGTQTSTSGAGGGNGGSVGTGDIALAGGHGGGAIGTATAGGGMGGVSYFGGGGFITATGGGNAEVNSGSGGGGASGGGGTAGTGGLGLIIITEFI